MFIVTKLDQWKINKMCDRAEGQVTG